MAELNRIKLSPLDNYNSLKDKYLTSYFNNPRIRRHLLQAGLVREDGEVVSASAYKNRLLAEQRWLASQAFLAQAIVQRALDLEYSRRAHLQRQLEQVIRHELVERVRSARNRNKNVDNANEANETNDGSESNHTYRPCTSRKSPIPQFFHQRPGSTGSTESQNKKQNLYQSFQGENTGSGSEAEDHYDSQDSAFSLHNPSHAYSMTSSYRFNETENTSPYLIPIVAKTNRSTWRSQSAPYKINEKSLLHKKRGAMLIQMQRSPSPTARTSHLYSCCDMTLRFLGTRLFISQNVNGGRQEVLIKQQICGGNPIIVYFQPLAPGSVFTFTSRRHHNFPLSITVHVDGVVVLRLSACCEKKYQPGKRLGGVGGYFVLVHLSGARPCSRCDPRNQNSPFLPPVLRVHSKSSGKPIQRSNSTWTAKSASATYSKSSHRPNSDHASEKSDEFTVSSPEALVTNMTRERMNLRSAAKFKEESEDEISEHIENSRMSTDMEENANEVEERLGHNSNEEDYTEDSECSSSDGCCSRSDCSDNHSVSEDSQRAKQPDGPAIKVTRPDAESMHTPSQGESKEGSSCSGTEESESTTEDEGTTRKFLTPEDAHAVHVDLKSSKADEEPSPKNENKTNGEIKHPTESTSVQEPFDSSDDDETRNAGEKTVVTAEVHKVPATTTAEHVLAADVNSVATTEANDNEEDYANGVVGEDPEENEETLKFLDDLGINVDSVEITLEGLTLTEVLLNQVAFFIENNVHLKELTIRNCALDDHSIIPLADSLEKSHCQLKSLNLNLNQLGAQSGPHIVRVIQANYRTLQSLHLHGNPLDDNAFCLINESILQLILAERDSPEGDQCFGLQYLDVGDCGFHNEGAANLATLIEHSPALLTLVLTGNKQLGVDEWCSLFWAVGQNQTITTLLLDYCDLQDEGVEILAKEIQQHPSLNTVDVEGNDISDRGGQTLSVWIGQNFSLREIRMEVGNNITDDVMVDIIRKMDNRR